MSCQAWKARQIAEQTIPLNDDAAGYVDAQLAPFADGLSLGRILRCVDAAVLRHDHDLAEERAKAAAEKRGVWVEDRLDGTSTVNAVADTPDAAALDSALNEVAASLGRLGDVDTHDVRRAKALGVLADPQYALDLFATAATDDGTTAGGRPPRRSGGPTIHVHLHTDSLADLAVGRTGSLGAGVARVEGYGPRALETVRQWLADLAPGSAIKLTPVVDLTEHIAVDAYEIPDRLRGQIEARDHGCLFPWCGRQGRYDLDHTESYDPDGPPGQTNTANLGRLCRFHHRVKTHSEWSYRRRGPTSVEWTSPHGRVYLVDHTGTREPG